MDNANDVSLLIRLFISIWGPKRIKSEKKEDE
jgi:hypothetical protein